MTNLVDYSSYVKYFTRQNKYEHNFNLPSFLEREFQTPDINKKLTVFATQFPVPSISATVHQSRIFDEKRDATVLYDIDIANITFLDTTSLFFHRMFNYWLLGLFRNDGALQYYPKDYETDITVVNYDTNIYKLEGVFPTSVGDFILNKESIDEFGQFDVSLHIKKIVPLVANSKFNVNL